MYIYTTYISNQSILKEINPEYLLEWWSSNPGQYWPPDEKSQLIREDPDAGKDWWQKETRAAEDEMVR